MTGYLLRRIGQALLILVLLSVVTFALLQLLPGGPAYAMLGRDATPEQIAAFNHANGYDQPVPVQYLTWVSHLVQGNLGYSEKLNQPVADAIARSLPKTIALMVLSTVVALVVAIGLATLQATHRNRAIDHVVTSILFVLFATPSFFLGIGLVLIFAVYAHVLPPQAPQSGSVTDILSDPRSLILPVVTLAVIPMTVFARYARSSMIDNLNEQYVRTARAKGLTERQILRRHVLRNSLLPLATLLGLSLPYILGGALVVEQVFNYPGMGLLTWRATIAKDYPVLLAVVMIVGVATVVGSLISDLLYAVLDPRIRYTTP